MSWDAIATIAEVVSAAASHRSTAHQDNNQKRRINTLDVRNDVVRVLNGFGGFVFW